MQEALSFDCVDLTEQASSGGECNFTWKEDYEPSKIDKVTPSSGLESKGVLPRVQLTQEVTASSQRSAIAPKAEISKIRENQDAVLIAVNPTMPITSEMLGRKVAEQLGFTETEMVLYSSRMRNAQNNEPFKSGSLAFWQVAHGLDEKTAMEMVRKELIKNNGVLRIAELNPGAFQEKRDWLADYRASDGFHRRVPVDFHQRTTVETVATHVVNPLLNLSASAMQSLASISDGVSIVSANPHEKWVYQECARMLRNKSAHLPMNDLYTKEERQDLAIGLMTLYMQAFGDNLPSMGAGKLAGALGKVGASVGRTSSIVDDAFDILKLPTSTTTKLAGTSRSIPHAVPVGALETAAYRGEAAVASEVAAASETLASNTSKAASKAAHIAEAHLPTAVGSLQSAGQSYDSAKSVQAVDIARREFGQRNVSTQEFEARVQAIKRGEGIDPAVKEQMERKATLAAALSATAGGFGGYMVGRLVRAVRDGTPVDSLPQSLFNDVRQELKLGNASGVLTASGRLVKHFGKEGAIGVRTGIAVGMTTAGTEEAAMVVANVKSGRQAFDDFIENAKTSAGQSALLFGTGQLLQIRLRGENDLDAARSKADSRHITYTAFRENAGDDAVLTGFKREHLPLSGDRQYHENGVRKWATSAPEVEQRVYSVKDSNLRIEVPETYARKLDEVRELRKIANQNLLESPHQFAKIWKARQELAAHAYKDSMLPEQAAKLVSESPNGSRVAVLSLYDIDPVKLGQAGTKDITMFGADVDARAKRTMMHEWSHLADQERITETTGRFKLAAALEKDGLYLVDYARKNEAENFAIHMGDCFLNENPSNLDNFAKKAPLRSISLALVLEDELRSSPHTSPHAKQLTERIEYVKETSVPLAKQDLIKRLNTSTSEEELKSVKKLIEEFTKHEPTRDLFGEEFLRKVGRAAEARLQDPSRVLYFRENPDRVERFDSSKVESSQGSKARPISHLKLNGQSVEANGQSWTIENYKAGDESVSLTRDKIINPHEWPKYEAEGWVHANTGYGGKYLIKQSIVAPTLEVVQSNPHVRREGVDGAPPQTMPIETEARVRKIQARQLELQSGVRDVVAKDPGVLTRSDNKQDGGAIAGQQSLIEFTNSKGEKESVFVHPIRKSVHETRLNNELVASELTASLFNTFPPVSQVRLTENGRDLTVRVQPYSGERLDRYSRANGVDGLRDSFRQAALERFVLGDADYHAGNFVVAVENGNLKIHNIDLDQGFIVEAPDTMPLKADIAGNVLYPELSGSKLTDFERLRISEFLTTYDSPEGRKHLEGRLSRRQMDAMFERARLLVNNGFPTQVIG